MPLPDDGPTEVEQVKAYLGIAPEDSGEDARLDLIVPAVNALVRGLPIVVDLVYGEAEDADEITWDGNVVLGATMLAARLSRRWNSPAGIAAMTAEGPVYIMRNDPDIAMMLQLGDYAKPVVG